MTTSKIFTYITAVVAVGLAYFLYYVVNDKVETTERIAYVESRVIEQLKDIREAQIAFQRNNGKYTADWDSLRNFIKEGRIYNISKKDSTWELSYGADTTVTKYDTLGYVRVYDSLFARKVNFKLESFEKAFESNLPFKINVGKKKEKTGAILSTIEVMDPKPFDTKRKVDADYEIDQPLKFGSKSEVKLAGNWE